MHALNINNQYLVYGRREYIGEHITNCRINIKRKKFVAYFYNQR